MRLRIPSRSDWIVTPVPRSLTLEGGVQIKGEFRVLVGLQTAVDSLWSQIVGSGGGGTL